MNIISLSISYNGHENLAPLQFISEHIRTFLGQDIENICNISKLAGIVFILYEDAF